MKRIILFIIALFLVIRIGFSAGDSQKTPASDGIKAIWPFGKSYNYSEILVTRIVDGDTIVIETGERVRLIGIDTPEIHESNKLYRDSRKSHKDVRSIKELGMKSFKFVSGLLQGQRVRLEFDVEKHDKYGRLLAYVYLKDGTFVNAKIVEQGYASLMTIPPNVKHAQVFQELYRDARQNHLGLWQEE